MWDETPTLQLWGCFGTNVILSSSGVLFEVQLKGIKLTVFSEFSSPHM